MSQYGVILSFGGAVAALLCSLGDVRGQSTFAGVVIVDGVPEPDEVEEFSAEGPTTSIATPVNSVLMHIGTGTAEASIGVLKGHVVGNEPLDIFAPSAVFAIQGYTDTITFFSDDLEPGEVGTLHLEFTLDGTVDVSAGSIGNLSLSLVNADFPDLSTVESLESMAGSEAYDNYSPPTPYYDPLNDISFDYGGADPALLVSLDLDVTNGMSITYGAALLISILGEGELDFSQTLTFSNATLSDSEGNAVSNASYDSEAGMGYGSFTPVPEPSAVLLVSLAGLLMIGWRKRKI